MNPVSQFSQEALGMSNKSALQSTLEMAEVMAKATSITREGEVLIVDCTSGSQEPATLDAPINKEVALEVQSFVAEKLLNADGWAILKQLFLITSEMLQTTQLFVLPVISEEELVKEKLGEYYEEFDKGFTALKEDLAAMSAALLALSKKHEGKTGAVQAEDQTLVAELASGYSNLQTQMETKVGPELMKQMSILEAAGVGADVLFASFAKSQEESEQ